MDSRRYDRNADLLAQIYWHYARLQKQHTQYGQTQIEQMLVLLQQCLEMNDELGQMAEKGLI
jgi:hypothetical protein